ncbi:MAG: GNAT family N-acetyltransferase [Marinagarivorans sp.]
MKLIRATCESDWELARKILLQAIEFLDQAGKSLWQKDQAEISALKRNYKLEELYFFGAKGEIYGMLFIQHKDLDFWSEIKEDNSLYIHKLAVLPKYKGFGYGYRAIDLVKELAELNNKKYIRLDCDCRQGLISFYEKYGFSLVSKSVLGKYQVVKYELEIANKSLQHQSLRSLDGF